MKNARLFYPNLTMTGQIVTDRFMSSTKRHHYNYHRKREPKSSLTAGTHRTSRVLFFGKLLQICHHTSIRTFIPIWEFWNHHKPCILALTRKTRLSVKLT